MDGGDEISGEVLSVILQRNKRSREGLQSRERVYER
jgi:hypothetical protein